MLEAYRIYVTTCCDGVDGLVHFRYAHPRAWCSHRVHIRPNSITDERRVVTCFWCLETEGHLKART